MKELFNLLTQLHYSYDRIMNLILHEHGEVDLSIAQLRILSVLWRRDGIRMIDLAKSLGIKKTTLSTMLPKLIEDGYVEQRVNPQDKRANLVYLTSKAQEIREKHREYGETWHDKLLDNISQEEITATVNTLSKLHSRISELEKEYKRNSLKEE